MRYDFTPLDKKAKPVRFDYMVRTRRLAPPEARTLYVTAQENLKDSPYYRSLRRVLQALTGESRDWDGSQWHEYLMKKV